VLAQNCFNCGVMLLVMLVCAAFVCALVCSVFVGCLLVTRCVCCFYFPVPEVVGCWVCAYLMLLSVIMVIIDGVVLGM